jgi:hypothetical protein
LLHRGPLRTVHARSRAHGPSRPLGRLGYWCPSPDRLEAPVPSPPYPHPWLGMGPRVRSPRCLTCLAGSSGCGCVRFKGPPAHVSTPFQGRHSARYPASYPQTLRAGGPGAAVCGFLLRFRRRRSLLGHPRPPDGIPPPLLSAYHHRHAHDAPAVDPGGVSTFHTHETRTGPGALCTPGTAVFTGHR